MIGYKIFISIFKKELYREDATKLKRSNPIFCTFCRGQENYVGRFNT